MSEPAGDLERMANQIARQFVANASVDAAAGVADHLQRFWSPGMRGELIAGIADGSINADPVLAVAIERGLI